MTDKILIQGLQFDAIVGVYDFEREQQQRLLVDAIIETDFSAAANSDDLSHTVNYASVAEHIIATTHELKPQLLEYLAEQICQRLFEQFPIQKITLTLKKPDILNHAEAVGVEVHRERHV